MHLCCKAMFIAGYNFAELTVFGHTFVILDVWLGKSFFFMIWPLLRMKLSKNGQWDNVIIWRLPLDWEHFKLMWLLHVPAQQALEENNNIPFSAVKNRAISPSLMMNTRREGQHLPVAMQTRAGEEAQVLWNTNILMLFCEAGLLEDTLWSCH